MSTAINYIYLVLYKLINFLFNTATIRPYAYNNVTISYGYILIAVIVLGLLIKNVLAIPSKSQGYTFKGGKDGSS